MYYVVNGINLVSIAVLALVKNHKTVAEPQGCSRLVTIGFLVLRMQVTAYSVVNVVQYRAAQRCSKQGLTWLQLVQRVGGSSTKCCAAARSCSKEMGHPSLYQCAGWPIKHATVHLLATICYFVECMNGSLNLIWHRQLPSCSINTCMCELP